LIVTKHAMMDGDESSKQKSDRYSLSIDSDFSKPIWVRHIGVQTDTVNERLLAYNVHSIWIGICVFIIVLCIL
jgi:hypothetical protein